MNGPASAERKGLVWLPMFMSAPGIGPVAAAATPLRERDCCESTLAASDPPVITDCSPKMSTFTQLCYSLVGCWISVNDDFWRVFSRRTLVFGQSHFHFSLRILSLHRFYVAIDPNLQRFFAGSVAAPIKIFRSFTCSCTPKVLRKSTFF